MYSKRIINKRIVSLLVILALTISTFLSSSNIVLAGFTEGEGTAESPYLIKTTNELFDIALNPTAHYKLANDLDFMNSKRAPINIEFKGVLDGDGHTIKNLNILGSGAMFCGVFAIVYGTVKDIVFDNIKVNSENTYVGVVAGSATNATLQVTIKNSQVTSTAGIVGGIVGNLHGTKVENCKVLNTTISGDTRVGGLSGTGTGSNGSTIKDNYIQDVTITGSSPVGGLIGSSSAENITGNRIKNVTITGEEQIGGLLGATSGSTVENCNVTDLIITGNNKIGGISGYSFGNTKFKNCYATKGEINGVNYIGGFTGQANGATFEQCYTEIDIIASENIVGGLIGNASSTYVIKCFSDNRVEGNSDVGGLIGTISIPSPIINDSYTNSSVKATDQSSGVGSGFVAGTAIANLKNCYTTSMIDAQTKIALAPSSTIANTTNSYFNQDITGITTPVSYARTTEDMLNRMNYGGWDFDTIWLIEDGKYPVLRFRDEITEEPPVIPPEEPIGSNIKIILEVGEELQLSVHDNTYDKSTLQWTSSDSSIVSVNSNGVIHAEKIGDAVITIKNAKGNILDKVSVSVVNTITNLRVTVELNVNKSCKLSVKDVQEEEAVTWTIDQAIATINNYGKVTAVGQGLTMATATDDSGSIIGQIYIRVI